MSPPLAAELKRRRVLRTAVLYTLIATGTIAFASDAFPALGLPHWTVRAVVISAIAGLPVALLLSWFFDIRVEAQPQTDPQVVSAERDPSSIAVLPFADLSPNKDQEYLSDGLTEELLNLLSKVDGIRVVARTSSFAFKGRNEEVSRIGDQLRVAHLLEGSIRTSGDQLRVTAQLIEAKTGYHIWSGTYDRQLRDLFAVQDEIAAAIVSTLEPRLAARPRPSVPVTSSFSAYQHYLRGRFHWHQKSGAALERALHSFADAIREDPTYAPAHAGLADTYLSLVDTDTARTEESVRLDRAKAAALAALKLDPELAEGYTSLGHVYIHHWKWPEAYENLHRAVQLNPGYAVGHQYFGILLTLTGRFDHGIRAIRRAQQLDPLSLSIHGTAGYLLYEARRFGEAEQQLREVLELDPARDGPHMRLGMVLLAQGRYDEALAELREAMRLRDISPTAFPLIAITLRRAGRAAQAQEVFGQVEQQLEQNRVSRVYSAVMFAEFGDEARAFSILNEMAESQHSGLVDLAADALFDPLRSDARFRQLLDRIGLPRLDAPSPLSVPSDPHQR